MLQKRKYRLLNNAQNPGLRCTSYINSLVDDENNQINLKESYFKLKGVQIDVNIISPLNM